MHPSCALIVWLSAVLAAQSVTCSGLAVLLALPLCWAPGAWRPWLAYVRRARWLLLALLLIMGYHTPGEAWLDQWWLPTFEGIEVGVKQIVRLLILLLWLAWLFVLQERQRLIGGLWWLLQSCRRFGLRVERLVVRLSLVLENIQAPPEPGAWRQMLHADARAQAGPESVSLVVPPWTLRDSVLVVCCVAGLSGVWML